MAGQNVHAGILTIGNTNNLPNVVDDWLFTSVASANAVNANLAMNLTSLLNEKTIVYMVATGGGLPLTSAEPYWYVYYAQFLGLGVPPTSQNTQIKDITQAATTKFPKTP